MGEEYTHHFIYSTDISIILAVPEIRYFSHPLKKTCTSEPPVGREADTVENVFETLWYHRAQRGRRLEFHGCRVYW